MKISCQQLKRHKLMWYDHLFRFSGMSKIIFQGTVSRKQEKRKARDAMGPDNMSQWTKKELRKSCKTLH